MRTPRPQARSSRGAGSIGTLIGNGWLRESDRNAPIPRDWLQPGRAPSRSALRKCMFMELPPDVAALAKALPPRGSAPIAAWKPIRRDDAPVVPHVRNPQKDVRLMKAIDPHVLRMKAALVATPKNRAWWEDPITLGTLLIVAPPVGLACVWMSKHYSNDARWALTVMSTLITCFAGAVALALLLTR